MLASTDELLRTLLLASFILSCSLLCVLLHMVSSRSEVETWYAEHTIPGLPFCPAFAYGECARIILRSAIVVT